MIAAALAFAQDASGWKISMEPKGELKASRQVPVQVTVKDEKGAPVSGADVELVLTMVDMDHGETKVPARQIKAGVYESKPKFLMDGKWNVEVRAKKGSASGSMKQQVEVGE
jgi:nitrogen fixation protein FixH